MSDQIEAHIILMGAVNVGKTCIVSRAVSNDFKEVTENTIGINLSAKAVEVGGTIVSLQIWDMAGLDRFHTLMRLYYPKSQVALLVFSVTDAASLNDPRTWAEEMKEQLAEMPTLFIVGNKSDLPDRKVQTQEGENLANELNATYFEVSAKTGNGIDELFLRIAAAALNNRAMWIVSIVVGTLVRWITVNVTRWRKVCEFNTIFIGTSATGDISRTRVLFLRNIHYSRP
jgi:Ras-related protein Rab-5C